MKLIFYEFSNKDSPVLDFIKSQEKRTRKLIYKKLNLYQQLLDQFGLQKLIQTGDVKKFKNGGFHEVIIGNFRFTGLVMENKFYLVYGFKKKGQKTKKQDIKTTIIKIKKILEEIK